MVKAAAVTMTSAGLMSWPGLRISLLKIFLSAVLLCFSVFPQAEAKGAEKDWTVMVYMCADNDLEEMALYDFLEMEQGITDNINVLVLLDRARGFSSLYGDESGTKVYEVKKSPYKYDYSGLITGKTVLPKEFASATILDLGELDLSDPRNLTGFMQFAAKNYPASRYALIPWDHGGGWKSMMMDLDGGKGKPGLGSMTAIDFAAALKQAVSYLPRGKLDVIIFEMCLMGQLDVLSVVAPYADYAFAAPPVMPAVGFDYSTILSYFAKDVSAVELLRKIADNTKEFLDSKHLLECAYSVYDLGKVSALTEAFNSLNAGILEIADKDYSEITKTLCFATHLNSLETDVNFGVPSYWTVSAADWLNQLEHSPLEIDKTLISNVRRSLSELVVHTTSTNNTEAFEGVSVYLPMRRTFMDSRYFGTAFARESGFGRLLEILYKYQEQKGNRQPVISDIEIGRVMFKSGQKIDDPADFSLKRTKEIRPFDKSVIRFKVTGEDILWTYLNQLERVNGRYLVHYSQLVREHHAESDYESSTGAFRRNSPYYKNGTTTLIRELTAQKYLITNGVTNADISIQNTSTSDTYNENISIGYAKYSDSSLNGQELHVKLKFSNRTRLLIGAEVVNQANSQLSGSALVLKPDGILRPALTYMDLKGNIQEEYGQPMAVGNILALTLGLVNEGASLRYMLFTQSVGGKTAFAASDEVCVRHDKELLALIENTRGHFVTELPGRYALMQYAATADGISILPNFRILSFNLSVSSPQVWKITDADGTPIADGLFNYITAGVPQLMLHEKHSNNLVTMLGPTVQSYYCFLESSGTNRQWYLVGLGDGTRSLLVPLKAFNKNRVQGIWVSDTEYWNIAADRIILYRPKEKLKASSTYEVVNNLIKADSLPFAEYAFYIDKSNNHLTLMSRDGHVSFLTRKETELDSGTVGPSADVVNGSSGREITLPAGEYLSGQDSGYARMTLKKTSAGFEMTIYSRGQGTVSCTFTVEDNYLDARFANGQTQRIGYHLHGDYLTLFFENMPPITFRRIP